MKILHALIGMGRAALVVAVPYPGKVSQISIRDIEELKKTKTKTLLFSGIYLSIYIYIHTCLFSVQEL